MPSESVYKRIRYQIPGAIRGPKIDRMLENSMKIVQDEVPIRGEIPGEEEAYLNFTLRAFEEIVKKYGGKEILKQLNDSTVMKLFNAFDDDAFEGGMYRE